jgi:hypothetical protein
MSILFARELYSNEMLRCYHHPKTMLRLVTLRNDLSLHGAIATYAEER